MLLFRFTILFCFVYFFSHAQTKPSNGLSIGEAAPKTDLLMQNVDGGGLSLLQAKNKNGLIVLFSCNTCPFVVGTPDFPGWENSYNLLFKEALRNKVGLVLVNSNEGKRDGADSFEEMKKHAHENNYKMPYLLDKNSILADAFGAKTTPHVYLFNKDLVLVYAGSIDNMANNKRKKVHSYLLNALLAQSNETKIKPTTTAPIGCSIKRIKKP